MSFLTESNSAPLFCLENLTSSQVFQSKPWDYRNGTRPCGIDKEAFRQWCANPATKHLFYSGFEGANAAMRVSENNPPVFMHALVADYDAVVRPGERDAFLSRISPDFPPNYICETFSKGVRLVWLFRRPIPVFSKKVTESFLAKLKKELCLKKLFPGLDEEALFRTGQYFQCGHDWTLLHPTPLSEDILHAWLLAVSSKADWTVYGDAIPISKIAEEVERRFPGRWRGPFEEGARGVRFWDDAASNPTSAIVRSSGMQCFTGPKPFVTWSEILGRRFVEDYRANTTGAAIARVWFDGRDYWREVDGVWRLFKKPDLGLFLRVAHGISDERRRGDNASPLDRVLNQIHQAKAIDGAAPFVYIKEQVVQCNGKHYLNIARSRLLPPAEEPQAWGQNFPWLAQFLDGFFDPPEQLDFMLSWLAYAYQQAYRGKPRNGQVSFVAGDVDQGKTFFSNGVCGGLFGGHMDASDYLLGESRFNKELFEVGLWCVDDTVPSSDPKKQQLYSAMLKKIPANYSFQYHPKFRDQLMLPWSGRVIVTCNADPESIRILPDTDMSLLDKINLFKIRTARRNFSGAADALKNELPFFARFLLDYQIPEHCRGDNRFGVKCYHQDDLIEEARQSSRTAGFAELIEVFRRSYFSNSGQGNDWQGNATELKQAMLTDDAIRPLVESYTVDALGRLLGKLESQQYPGLSRLPRNGLSRLWCLEKTPTPAHGTADCPF